MTIGVHPNRQKVPFASFAKNLEGQMNMRMNQKQTKALALKGFTRMILVKRK
jgi:hypothetical protein